MTGIDICSYYGYENALLAHGELHVNCVRGVALQLAADVEQSIDGDVPSRRYDSTTSAGRSN